jgi:plastocyanin
VIGPCRSALALAAVVPVALLAGCGSSSSSSANSTTSAATAKASASTVAVKADPSGALAYVEKSLSTKAGKTTFVFTNASSVPHNLTFEVASTEHELGGTKTITSGTASLTLTLPKGKYHYYCSVPGHEAAGMSGILTVS